jgi:hypothetical protein
MPSNDNRLYYNRVSRRGLQLPVKKAFLDARPIVKTPADEGAGTEAVYYSEADGLTLEQFLRLYAPHRAALFDESNGPPKDNRLGTLADHPDGLPEAMTHALIGPPAMRAEEVEAIVLQAAEAGVPIRAVLIHFEDLPDYLANGIGE